MDKWELAYSDYADGMKYKDIADKHGVSINTVKSWKSRKWTEIDKVAPKRVAHNKKQVAHKKKLHANKMSETVKAIDDIIDNDELSEKEKLFCLEYSNSYNATQSYINVYGSAYTTAMVNGPRLLGKARVKAQIEHIREARALDWLVNEADIINEWIKQAFANISDFITFKNIEEPARDMFGGIIKDEETGEPLIKRKNILEFKPSDQVDGTLIQEVKQGKDGASIKLYDKQVALRELHKLIGPDRVIKLAKMEIEADKARLELKALREELEGSDDLTDDNDGFLEAIEQSLKAVWGDADES